MWWKPILSLVLKLATNEQVVAWVLAAILRRTMAAKPSGYADGVRTLGKVLEAAQTAVAVVEKGDEAKAEKAALAAWAEAKKTPEEFRAKRGVTMK